MYEKELNQFKKNGYIYFQSNLENEVQILQNLLLDHASNFLKTKIKNLDKIHQIVNLSQVNDFRIEMIKFLNKQTEFRNNIQEKLYPIMSSLLGPDLVIQKNTNLVLAFPNDEASQIPLHSDVWTGHSPYELNMWIPLNEVRNEMSMYILPFDKWMDEKNKIDIKNSSINLLLEKWKDKLEYVEMEPGCVYVFWHHLPHGNHTHQLDKTRWSLNIRVKNLFSPYGEKNFGEYFVPWKISPLTEMVLNQGEMFL
jgi:sporadic carbohydrate cluster 2OG-Fe(II) oxygenase